MSEQEQPQKKVLYIQSGFSDEKLNCAINTEDETKTVEQIIIEQAEAMEQQGPEGSQKAMQLMNMIQQGVYVNTGVGQSEISPKTKVKDLTFQIDFTSGQSIRVAELTMQKQFTLG